MLNEFENKTKYCGKREMAINFSRARTPHIIVRTYATHCFKQLAKNRLFCESNVSQQCFCLHHNEIRNIAVLVGERYELERERENKRVRKDHLGKRPNDRITESHYYPVSIANLRCARAHTHTLG